MRRSPDSPPDSFLGRRRAGFTLLETLIAATVLLLITGSLVTALGSLEGVTSAGKVESRLQEAGERALAQIVADLKQSGFVQVGGKDFPFLFNEGNANENWQGIPVAPAGQWGVHSHVPPVHQAQLGDPDFGVTREIVFALPQDADGDGVPDLDPNGELVWDASEFSYVLVTGPDGVNYLQRRTNGASPRKAAMFVERVVFDHNASTLGTASVVPLDAIRIQLFLRQNDETGLVHRYTTQAVVRMRNGLL